MIAQGIWSVCVCVCVCEGREKEGKEGGVPTFSPRLINTGGQTHSDYTYMYMHVHTKGYKNETDPYNCCKWSLKVKEMLGIFHSPVLTRTYMYYSCTRGISLLNYNDMQWRVIVLQHKQIHVPQYVVHVVLEWLLPQTLSLSLSLPPFPLPSPPPLFPSHFPFIH